MHARARTYTPFERMDIIERNPFNNHEWKEPIWLLQAFAIYRMSIDFYCSLSLSLYLSLSLTLYLSLSLSPFLTRNTHVSISTHHYSHSSFSSTKKQQARGNKKGKTMWRMEEKSTVMITIIFVLAFNFSFTCERYCVCVCGILILLHFQSSRLPSFIFSLHFTRASLRFWLADAELVFFFLLYM